MMGEAALMDRIYRRQRHVYDLTRKYYLLGRDELIERFEHGVSRPELVHGADLDQAFQGAFPRRTQVHTPGKIVQVGEFASLIP